MKLTPELESEIRRCVNQLYVNVPGTESYERSALLGEIDRLRMLVSELEGITAFDSALRELEARGRRIDALNAALEDEHDDNMRLRESIQQTLNENGHLADGENCTLIVLKRAVAGWVEARNAPVTGMFGIAERNSLIRAEDKLERTFDVLKCKKCGADMHPGVAMAQTLVGKPDFIGGEVCTVSPGGPGKLIECSKC